MTDAAGNMPAINKQDEYGMPAAGNLGYTGQAFLPELGLYHYKSRAYSPSLGRFMQTDTIGYDGGMILYAYTGEDPVNATDPTGTIEGVAVTARRPDDPCQDTGGICQWIAEVAIDQLSFFVPLTPQEIRGVEQQVANQSKSVPQNTCSSAPGINGRGVSAGVQLDAGLGNRGTVQSESLGLGLFGNGGGPGSLTAGGFRTSIDSTFSPSTAGTNQAFGDVAQGGVSIFATNARSVRELSRPFNTISGAIGIGAGASFQYSYERCQLNWQEQNAP